MDAWTGGLAGVGVLAFATTNIDDLLVLVAFLSNASFRKASVVAGQYLGIAALVAASAVSYFLRLVLPGEWIGLAGLVPVALGVKGLFELRHAGVGEPEVGAEPRRGALGASQALAVAAVTVANGGDNIGVYVPLFAASSPREIILLASVFLSMTGVWLLLAWALVSNKLFGERLRRIGRTLLPVVLFALGVYILARQRSWILVARLLGR